MTTPEQRQRMAAAILAFEARRDRKTGELVVYKLPKGDGGGEFEVAGINERYHPEMARALADLIDAGKQGAAEREAIAYLASYTDVVADWTSSPAIEAFLRDCAFNRGPTGAARILQLAAGVEIDGHIGTLTRAAVAEQEAMPARLLNRLRSARESYERDVVKRNESSPFWTGLVNRWDKALQLAESFLHEPAGGAGREAVQSVATNSASTEAIRAMTDEATRAVTTIAPFDPAQAIVAAARLAAGASPLGALAPLLSPILTPLIGSTVERLVDSIHSGASGEPQLSRPQYQVAFKAMRIGSHSDLVKAWQSFLAGQGFDPGGNDGDFGDKTDAATKAFQARHGLEADGIVGRQTMLKSMELGFELIEEPATDMTGSNFPPRPSFPPLTSTGARQAVFGPLEFVAAPRADNPEAIRILGGWEAESIVTVPIPQLRKALGPSAPSAMRFHRRAATQLQGLWADWEAAGLLNRVLSYEGAYVPRFIRGSRTTLSNHAFGTAFDINAATNGLGVRPTLVGGKGSVRELVPLAHKWGFYWGGHFGSRADGMHFEVAVVMEAGR